MKDMFAPIEVYGKMKENSEYGQENRTVQFFNVRNDKIVLEIGTDNINDYYPWYVATFNRENLE